MSLRDRIVTHRVPTILSCSLFATSLLFAAPAEIRQGESGSEETPDRVFTSPMVIETDLAAAAEDERGVWVASREFERYVCDRVRLIELDTLVTAKKDRLLVSLKVRTYTEPGHDKKVRIDFELRDSDRIIGVAYMQSIDAEEKKVGKGHATMKIPSIKWSKDRLPKLQLTLTAVDG